MRSLVVAFVWDATRFTSNMKTSIKVGLVGCGKISAAYVTGIRNYPGLEIAACADVDEIRAREKAREYGIPKAGSVAQLLADPEIEIVVNLTIPTAHTEINQLILRAGKHAYSEKPFALTSADATSLLALAAEKKRRIGSAPDTFLGGGIQTCRKLIDDGAIGEPVAATAFMLCRGHESWHPSPAFYYQRGGGPMFDMGPYYLTALVNLLGPAQRVSGSARKTFPERLVTSQPLAGSRLHVDVPTHYAGTVEFSSGAVASLIMSFDVYKYPLPHIVVFGTEGTLEVPDPNWFGGDVRLSRFGSDLAVVPPTHSIERARGTGLADLAYALQSGRAHRANGELAAHVVEVMEAFEESSLKGRHVEIISRCERPAMLPLGLASNELDS